MKIQGLLICDHCGGIIFPNDGTPVRLQTGEHRYEYHYHNTKPDDCLSKKLFELRMKFATQQNINY